MSSTNDRQSYLIDTNILIKLEDYHVIEKAYANFAELVASYKVDVFVHEVTKDDIGRDKNIQRREISLSKISKYQIIPKHKNLVDPTHQPASRSMVFGDGTLPILPSRLWPEWPDSGLGHLLRFRPQEPQLRHNTHGHQLLPMEWNL